MKALSIRQPWAWLIVNGHKDIENRSWPTKFRGRFLVHASKGMTRWEYFQVDSYALDRGVFIPKFEDLQRGGIVGSVELVDCVTERASPWFANENYGFVLRNARVLPFHPMTGKLGFFETYGVSDKTRHDGWKVLWTT